MLTTMDATKQKKGPEISERTTTITKEATTPADAEEAHSELVYGAYVSRVHSRYAHFRLMMR